MPKCNQCGDDLARSHRKLWEKPIYSVVFTCRLCETRAGMTHRYFNYFGPYAKCPRCGNGDLRKRETLDRIDRLLRTPISWLQGLFGANLYHCVLCRMQFYDFRSFQRSNLKAPSKTVLPVP